MRFARGALCGALMLGYVPLVVWPHPASAGEKDKAGHEAAPAKPAAAAKQTPALMLPDADKIVLLVRTTLLTVNDAIHTGNFTVLRDKAAPSFRDGTTPTSLGQSLDSLAKQRIDLSAVAIIAPQLTDLPSITDDGVLHLKGYFPGQPVGIGFDLAYQAVGGSWRLLGLNIGLVKPPKTAASTLAPEAKSKADAAKAKP